MHLRIGILYLMLFGVQDRVCSSFFQTKLNLTSVVKSFGWSTTWLRIWKAITITSFSYTESLLGKNSQDNLTDKS